MANGAGQRADSSPAPGPAPAARRAKLPSPRLRSWAVRILVLTGIVVGLAVGFLLPFSGGTKAPGSETRANQSPVRLSSELDTNAPSLSDTVTHNETETESSPPETATTSASGAVAVTVAGTSVTAPVAPLFRAAVTHQGVPPEGGPFTVTLTVTSLSAEPLTLNTEDVRLEVGTTTITPTTTSVVNMEPGERISVDLEYLLPEAPGTVSLYLTIDDHEVKVFV